MENVMTKRNISAGLFLLLITGVSLRLITPPFHTWSTTSSDAGIYLAFIPNFWVAHPGGATVYTFLGFLWSNLFLIFNVSVYDSLLWMNTFIGLLTVSVAFYWAMVRGLNVYFSSIAAFTLILSAISFSQFGVIESYPLHALLLLVFFFSWDMGRRNNWKGWKWIQIIFGGLCIGSHHTLLFVVALTYLLGMFFRHKENITLWRGIPKEAFWSGLIGLFIYSTIVFRGFFGLTFDAQIDYTAERVLHYFRALTPIFLLNYSDLPIRIFSHIPIFIISFAIPILILSWGLAFKGKEFFREEKLYWILSSVYIFYVLTYLSTQGYRYYTVLPIILLPLVFKGFSYVQEKGFIWFSLSSCFIIISFLLLFQIHFLYPNNDMEKMRDKLYELKGIAEETGEQQIILTQYYNEVIGTYWNEVFNHGFLDDIVVVNGEVKSLEEIGEVEKIEGMNLGELNNRRVSLLFSDIAPVIVIPSIYTIQDNNISERYTNLLQKNSTSEFNITHCMPPDASFIPFETYYCVAEEGLRALQNNPNIHYHTVNPHDTLGEQYGIPEERIYITKQDPTSYIKDENANYYSRWYENGWLNGVEGRPYWAAFIRGDFEHPYWDSDNYSFKRILGFDVPMSVMFVFGWSFVIGCTIYWILNRRTLRA